MVHCRVRKYLPLLRFLQESKHAKHIIDKSDREIIDVICECVHNIIQGNVDLSKDQKKRLKKHKRDLLLLTDKKSSLKKKKKAIQKGGFLGVLLSAAIPAIIGAIAGTA